MARLTTPGIWLPGPLNTINSPSVSAQADIAGNPFWMGLNAGKLVVLSDPRGAECCGSGDHALRRRVPVRQSRFGSDGGVCD